MSFFDTSLLIAYFSVLLVLAIFGVHRYAMVYRYYRYRDRRPEKATALASPPSVVVQLPIFNERYVALRVIDAAAALDYPPDRLEIQVLDDSTDETSRIASERVDYHRSRGIDIRYLHREDREGFKAGALDSGLSESEAKLVAVFDADFIPESDFLKSVVPYFKDERIGMVQARWGHINDDYSLLTRVQSVLLDAHFVLEHGGRNRSGCFFNFNGTAGVWRRRCIDHAGGWQHDTLTEDMDLSYRAQLKGWRFLFLPDVVTPAEIPVTMSGFRTQQQRWAKGSIQTAKKLLPRILASPIPGHVKAEALFHLSANLSYPLMVVLSVLMFPSMMIRYDSGWSEMLLIDLPLFVAATASVTSFYVVSQKEIYRDWLTRLRVLPMLLCLGIGMSLNNAKAVIEGLLGLESGFVRTPKYGIQADDDGWFRKTYRSTHGLLPWLELSIGVYFSVAVAYGLNHRIFASLPFLMLFQVGFLYTATVSFTQSLSDWRVRTSGKLPKKENPAAEALA